MLVDPPRTQSASRGGIASLTRALAFSAVLVVVTAACASRPPATPAGGAVAAAAGTAITATATTTEPRSSATITPGAAAVSPVVTRTPADSPTPTSTPPARGSFTVEVDPPVIGQGETLLVRVTGAFAGTVTGAGRTTPLQATATGAWAVIGVGLYTDLGVASVNIAGRDAQGNAIGDVPATYTVVDPKRPADYLVVTEEVGAILTPEAGIREAQARAEQFARFDPTPRWRIAFRYPLLAFEVTTLFGSGRSINGGPVGDFHSGEDLAADEGTPATVAAPGRVAWAGAMPIRGNSVIVDHGGGVMTGYHHLRDISVTVNQQVEAGTLIGHVGSTGFSTGPHLHWELTIYGVNVDPETWTTRPFPR